MKLFDLTGKVALITGGAVGLGKQMATGLAEAGADVVICSRKIDNCQAAAEEIRQIGTKVLPLKCDVTDPDDVRHMVETTINQFGKIDILVNNAGRAWAAKPEDLSLEDWNKVMNVNVTGTFLCSQAVGRTMIPRRYGKIINIASVSGMVGKNPKTHNNIVYSTSKGAVVNFTRDLAVKWAQHNINVNAIAPGVFPTRLSEWLIKNKMDEVLSEIPLNRVGGEDDLKGAVVFLASEASCFITGHILAVDGGVLAW